LSAWESTLNADGAIQLGLQRVQGLGELSVRRLLEARALQPFRDVADLARRAGLDRRTLEALAAADALADLAGHRHAARWAVQAVEAPLPLFAALDGETQGSGTGEDGGRADGSGTRGVGGGSGGDDGADDASRLPPPREGREIFEDYRSLGLTLRRHPLAVLRPRLQAQRLLSAVELQQLAHGQLARAAGIVTCRQRPGTAGGVTFLTLEDETGLINIVVWRDIAARQRRELLGASLLAVYGVVQRDGPVVHLVARRLADRSPWLGGLNAASRDFH
jgi:error-prone DNA polymerase